MASDHMYTTVFLWLVSVMKAACLQKKRSQKKTVSGCPAVRKNDGKQHVVPFGSSRGPRFSSKRGDSEWITPLLSRLLQTGLCAQHLRTGWHILKTQHSTRLPPCHSLPAAQRSWHSLSVDHLWISQCMTSYCFICSTWTCVQGTPTEHFCNTGAFYSKAK